jgi:hypothetical protein
MTGRRIVGVVLGWSRAAAGAAMVTMVSLSPAVAQTPAPTPAATPPPPNTGRISLSGGIDVPTDYYFRGIVQETEDFIMQPFFNLTFKLYEADEGVLTGVNFTTGIWNSLHWGPTGDKDLVGDPHNWYEADAIAGLSATFFKDLTLGVTYTAYTSPNGFFNTVQEIALGVNYNDSKLLGPFALNPSLLIAFETDGQADAGRNEGVYMQVGLAPGLTLLDKTSYPLTLTFPLTLGLSLSDYYERIGVGGGDDTFGYFSMGASLAVPLAFIPPSFGTWQLKATLQGLFLGDNLKAVNGGDGTEIIGTFGIAFSY